MYVRIDIEQIMYQDYIILWAFHLESTDHLQIHKEEILDKQCLVYTKWVENTLHKIHT